MEGISFNRDCTIETEQTTIKIKGVILRYLFRKDVFKGDLRIENLSVQSDAELWDLDMEKISKNENYSGSPFQYIQNHQFLVVGWIFIRDNFKEIFVVYDNDNFFAAPASDRQEAMDIIKYMPDFGIE